MGKKIDTTLERMRQFQASGETHDIPWRKQKLKQLLAALQQNKTKILSALASDLHKSEFEATMTEYFPAVEALKYMIRHLKRWAKPQRRSLAAVNFPGRGFLLPEPYGVVLVGGTWNYPFLLAIEPVIGAIAGGNCVLLKLSDQAPVTAHVLMELLTSVFDDDHLAVTVESWDVILQKQFDFIFFTGGAKMGRVVLEAAAKFLTPVTLELGGKSPCIVEADADLKLAAKRIVWGKFLNAGQTCVAPDYLLVHSSVKDELTRLLRVYVREFYGDNPQESPDYPRIINTVHYERLGKLLTEGRLLCGGEKDPDSLYIAPTVIDNITLESALMEQEIFGPILPVLTYETIEEAIALINSRPKPLALYLFSSNAQTRKLLQYQSSSGALVVNDAIMHLMNPMLPFGGVGESGMGCYHGKYSFSTFVHYKPVMLKNKWFDLPMRYPPFSLWKLKLLRLIAR